MSPEHVVAYLLEQGLLLVPDLVNGDVEVSELPGRNRDFRIVSSAGASYFLKAADTSDVTSRAGVRLEAALYARIWGDARCASLRPFVPRLCHYDAARALLILELRRGACAVHELEDSDWELRLPAVTRALARAVALFHRVPRETIDPADSAFLPRMAPWVLDIARPPIEVLRVISPAQMELIGIVQRNRAVHARLAEARRNWRPLCLIHGDLKWQNVLVELASGGSEPPGITLVDWELASFGDPAWDVGSLFHSYLVDSLLSASADEGQTPHDAADAFARTGPTRGRAAMALWCAYKSELRLPGVAAHGFLPRAQSYCAARLIQSAYEWSRGALMPPRHAVMALQLAVNMLCRPRAAWAALFDQGPLAGVADS